MTELQLVRTTAAWIMSRAKHVSIDVESLSSLSRKLADRAGSNPPRWRDFPAHYWRDDDPESVAQYCMAMDALNFCFWPVPGLEYEALAGGLRRVLERDRNALDGERLAVVTEEDLASWVTPQMPELEERARLVRECGAALLGRWGGRAANLIREANHSAARLVSLVTQSMPGFRDGAVFAGRQCFFYKRAQIFAGDVWGAFEGKGLGALEDIGSLTMFPDYRVPQLLHSEGVLRYVPELDAAVRSGQEIAAGTEQECEIRAASVQAVDLMSTQITRIVGKTVPPIQIDWLLWGAGEESLSTLIPHHRTRTIFY